ncbi:AtpZ/AtpI family protein [Roseomonas sp. HF4]|uniref:AtpZ/AtpI family protein n=1 Tax=Roseomonas sp. HF4 TaxID=2562313 RepID=UPI0010C1003E|nr:AtpZ/AtpI family protein [Roseomonas sp. HF4]
MTRETPPGPGWDDRLSEQVGRKATRKLKARSGRRHVAWLGLGVFGLIGWSIAVPVILGVVIGRRMDAWVEGRASWKLVMPFAGLVLGCINAWYWTTREARDA